MSKSNADTLRQSLSKIAATMSNLAYGSAARVKFPDHLDGGRTEQEFVDRANRIHLDLMWMDNRLTEKIIYASEEAQK